MHQNARRVLRVKVSNVTRAIIIYETTDHVVGFRGTHSLENYLNLDFSNVILVSFDLIYTISGCFTKQRAKKR